MLLQFDAEVQTLARNARDSVIDVFPEVVEVTWVKQRISSHGVGPKKMSEHVCYIALFKYRINLGFYCGFELPDPEGLMEGSGKLLRHIKISNKEQLKNPAVRDLIETSTGHLPRLKK